MIFKDCHHTKTFYYKSTVFKFQLSKLHSPQISCGHAQPQETEQGREIENYGEIEIYSRDLGFRQLIISLFQNPRHGFYAHNTYEKLTLQLLK